ncbi:hypothetical protein D3C83_40880 [compost metagenome]
MMRPHPRSAMPSITGLLMLNTLSRLVRITASHPAFSIFRNVVSRVMPALFTSTSIGPTSDWILPAVLWQDSKSETSTAAAWNSKPCRFISASQSPDFLLPGE